MDGYEIKPISVPVMGNHLTGSDNMPPLPPPPQLQSRHQLSNHLTVPFQSTAPIKQNSRQKTLPRQKALPRQKLPDRDKREICQYALKNPKAKQKEIASIFDVERSTVSKVLRDKKKWLSQEDRSGSLSKRTDQIKKEEGNDVRRDSTIRKTSEAGSPDFIPLFFMTPQTSGSARFNSPIDQYPPSVSANANGPFSSVTQFSCPLVSGSCLIQQTGSSPGDMYPGPQSNWILPASNEHETTISPSPCAEAPGFERAARNFGSDTAMPPGTLHQGMINSAPSVGFARSDHSSLAYPSQEEARCAAQLLLSWMQNAQPGIIGSSELALVVRLMKMLEQRPE